MTKRFRVYRWEKRDEKPGNWIMVAEFETKAEADAHSEKLKLQGEATLTTELLL